MQRVDGQELMETDSICKVAAFLNSISSLTSHIAMTILPSFLIVAPTLLCIFSVVFIELIFLTFNCGDGLRH